LFEHKKKSRQVGWQTNVRFLNSLLRANFFLANCGHCSANVGLVRHVRVCVRSEKMRARHCAK
jgi:hypothetical protein